MFIDMTDTTSTYVACKWGVSGYADCLLPPSPEKREREREREKCAAKSLDAR